MLFCHPKFPLAYLQERERLREAERNASSKVTLDRTVLDRHAPWGPSAVRDAQDPELAAILREVTFFSRRNLSFLSSTDHI